MSSGAVGFGHAQARWRDHGMVLIAGHHAAAAFLSSARGVSQEAP
jgi:hypothetical protein